MLCRPQKYIAYEFLGKRHYLATVFRYKGTAIKGISLCVSNNDIYKCDCFPLISLGGTSFLCSPDTHIPCIPISSAEDICNCASVLDRTISNRMSGHIWCKCMFSNHQDCILLRGKSCKLASSSDVACCPFLLSTRFWGHKEHDICHIEFCPCSPALWKGFRDV